MVHFILVFWVFWLMKVERVCLIFIGWEKFRNVIFWVWGFTDKWIRSWIELYLFIFNQRFFCIGNFLMSFFAQVEIYGFILLNFDGTFLWSLRFFDMFMSKIVFIIRVTSIIIDEGPWAENVFMFGGCLFDWGILSKSGVDAVVLGVFPLLFFEPISDGRVEFLELEVSVGHFQRLYWRFLLCGDFGVWFKVEFGQDLEPCVFVLWVVLFVVFKRVWRVIVSFGILFLQMLGVNIEGLVLLHVLEKVVVGVAVKLLFPGLESSSQGVLFFLCSLFILLGFLVK